MTVATGTPHFVWYLMRGSGLVSLVLLSITVALGVIGAQRWKSSRWPRLVTAGLHRNLSLLAVCFLGIHIVTATVDSFIGLSWIGVIVPFTSGYRPLWVGLGVLAFDLLAAVTATSLLRARIGFHAWRLIHWCTWLLWPLAVSHALGSGTDVFSAWGLAITGGCVGLVAVAAAWRLWPVRRPSTRVPVARAGSTPPLPRTTRPTTRLVMPLGGHRDTH